MAARIIDKAIAEAARQGRSIVDGTDFRLHLLQQSHAELEEYAKSIDDPKAAAWIQACLEVDRDFHFPLAVRRQRPSLPYTAIGVATVSITLAAVALVAYYPRQTLTGEVTLAVPEVPDQPAVTSKVTPVTPAKTVTQPLETVIPVSPPPTLDDHIPLLPAIIVEAPRQPKVHIQAPGEEGARDFNDPEAVVELGALNNAKTMTLRGKIKRLVVDLVDGGAQLDASGLQVDEIVFKRPINGGSTVKVNSPQGNITFEQEINGKSRVEIIAPGGNIEFHKGIDGSSNVDVVAGGGKVRFGSPTDPAADKRSIINGESQVSVIARQVDFGGVVDGTQTRIQVALSKMGTLKCYRITGAAKLLYRKDNVTDPELTVDRGLVSASAELRQID